MGTLQRNAGVEERSTPLTVTALVQLFNKILESAVPAASFEGEISQYTLAASGHLYFTVKDSNSSVSAVMWRSSVARLKFRPREGLQVICNGKPNVYHKSGRLQVVVSSMQESGEGALQRKFLELKAKLEKEGLFAEERKRELPFLPKVVGVVTSSSGAALHDILVKIRERSPQVQVILAPAKVQGDGAADEVARAIGLLNTREDVEVIIVGRGGGSLEDLWAFNEEVAVRAVFRSRIPIVSAVGHEVDIALTDLAADLRAPTPTAAAEAVVPSRERLFQELNGLSARLVNYQSWFMPLAQSVDELAMTLHSRVGVVVQQTRLRLQLAERGLRSIEPARVLRSLRERLERLEVGLFEGAERRLARSRERLQRSLLLLQRVTRPEGLSSKRESLERLRALLFSSASSVIGRKLHPVERLNGRLEALNPKRVLERGFSLVEQNGTVVTRASELSCDEVVNIRFSVGTADATVVSVHDEK